jgi:hypothetical protein
MAQLLYSANIWIGALVKITVSWLTGALLKRTSRCPPPHDSWSHPAPRPENLLSIVAGPLKRGE